MGLGAASATMRRCWSSWWRCPPCWRYGRRA